MVFVSYFYLPGPGPFLAALPGRDPGSPAHRPDLRVPAPAPALGGAAAGDGLRGAPAANMAASARAAQVPSASPSGAWIAK